MSSLWKFKSIRHIWKLIIYLFTGLHWVLLVAGGISVIWPGTEPTLAFIVRWAFNQWTTSKVQEGHFWKGTILLLRWICMMLWSICLFFCLDLLHQLKCNQSRWDLLGNSRSFPNSESWLGRCVQLVGFNQAVHLWSVCFLCIIY